MIEAHVLTAIKDATDLAPLVESHGIRLHKQAGRKVGFCPFCQTKQRTPAFAVYRNHYFCYRCEATGNCFRWLMNTQGLTFADAVEYLASVAGIRITTGRVNPGQRAASAEDLAASRWWWKRRIAAVQTALDAIMADGPPDVTDPWADCVSKLLRAAQVIPEAERLQVFRLEVTDAERAEWRSAVAGEKARAALYEGVTVRDWVRETLAAAAHQAESLNIKLDPSEYVARFGAAAYRNAVEQALVVPEITL